MAIVLFDSNILIDHTLGYSAATDELANYDDAAISVITWMEVTCMLNEMQLPILEIELHTAGIKVIHTNDAIMRRAAALRGATKRKLPDCIIRATAEVEGRVVVTRNPVDFGGASSRMVHIPYIVESERVMQVFPPVE
jgi:predicted nucleic acid-binding protein